MESAVTLADVARVAGVSRATASRALNGRDGVRPDVRDRTRLVAESLGYRPNRAARNLAKGRSSVIGVVITSAELQVDPYGAALLHAVARAAEDVDHSMMLLLASSKPGTQVSHNMRDGLIDGLIVSGVACGLPWVQGLLESSLDAVMVGQHPSGLAVPTLDTENRESSARAVTHLFEQGCQRVATITGPLERVDASQRLAGYRDAHEQANIPVDESLVIPGDFTIRSGQQAATDFLLDLSPDGLFASNDGMAIGAMSVLERAGRSIPSDIAVVGFDGISAAERVGVSLTTLQQPFAELGEAAVAELLALMDGRETADLLLLPPELIVGESSLRRPTPTEGPTPP